MTLATESGTDRDDPGFYARLPSFDSFARLADPATYAPVPDGWVLGLADIVQSTEAIGAGRYKEVNTAAAAVIAALSNALPGKLLPFVFGGDGASFALAPDDEAVGRQALARTAAWITASFGLTMRTAMVSVEDIRRAGLDLRLARFAVSPDVSYAMFSGGGLAWGEARMKAGDDAIPPATDGIGPDLTGLSCRFSEIPARNGVILSLIAMPKGAGNGGYASVVSDLLAIADEAAGSSNPVPQGGPQQALRVDSLLAEAKTAGARTARPLALSAIRVGLRMVIAHLIFRFRRRIGGFDPMHYLAQLVRNSDFRKFDDGLRMTLDCTENAAERIEARLRRAADDGIVVFGTHRQAAALMTCFVPSPTRSDHVHFVDGASGGYAMAARSIKDTMEAASALPR
ncbi:hypothetical protein Sa4125_24420 [Aureimonas sp. SA4125]|uniref:DUF3095 domain-containing protein n=1 Tax=Aureimonas sp. SA4125 TaxID=2826993 RepID=UPI001CC4FDDD|nr:DUF3095 domain-containing protein [Aureimonas sp. SA4125]BDA84900.1 hypothetical protein Sa4125_24420 [Aureimonas sp. SA4125]